MRDADRAGIKRIRVHSLRHSHCAYLIHLGVQPMIIKERLENVMKYMGMEQEERKEKKHSRRLEKEI